MQKLLIFLALILNVSTLSAQFQLKGSIRDSITGQPLSGASVWLDGSNWGLLSDGAGEFEFRKLPGGSYSLRVSLLGYNAQVIPIALEGNITVNILMRESALLQEAVTITAIRGSDETTVASSLVTKEDLKTSNLGQDLPYLLNMTPSVVVHSDAGGGVGYTGIRIRGSDPTRVNVTINSIPLNDAESQQVYWVDLPDFASSAEDIQIQRGAGTSTNGSGAFGASLNIRTDNLQSEAFAELNNSIASFNTRKHNLRFGTGLLSSGKSPKDFFALSGRLSLLNSDGYIDRAFSNLNSMYLSGGWFRGKTMVKAVVISGKEKTYQAWYGVPQDSLQSNRRYNEKSYDNEIDDYGQTHYQLHASSNPLSWINLNVALHYTQGKGYYEQYRQADLLNDYGIDTLPGLSSGDVIRRRWLDNDFYGFTFSGNLRPAGKKFDLSFGGAGNQYLGRHFGEVIWATYTGNIPIRHRYYNDKATKNEINFFSKFNWSPVSRLTLFLDAQYRSVGYAFTGLDSSGASLPQKVSIPFFNPKAGIFYKLNPGTDAFFTLAVAGREPNRDDFTQSSPASRPGAERMLDIETGFRTSKKKIRFSLTGYCMYYKNQLVLTGQINDVGAYTRTNIPKSYRAGLEIEGSFRILSTLLLSANATLSRNRILGFTEYIDDYDSGIQLENHYDETDLAFSPALISSARLSWSPMKGLECILQEKYVGKQYLDNTSNPGRALDAFWTTDLLLSYSLPLKALKELRFNVMLNNLFNHLYEPNGYTYSYVWGGQLSTFNYYYPQAGRNFLLGVCVRF